MESSGRAQKVQEDHLRVRLIERVEEQIDRLSAQIVREIRAESPEYAAIPPDLLAPGVTADLAAALAGIKHGPEPGPDELEIAARVGEHRAAAGISVEALFQAFRVGGRVILEHCRRVADEAGFDPDVLVDINRDAWEFNSKVSTAAAVGHRRHELAGIRAGAEDRAAFLYGLMHGTLSPARVRGVANTLGITTDQPIFAIRVRTGGIIPAHRVETMLADRGGAATLLVGPVDGDVAGVVLRRPELPAPLVAGIGPAVAELSELGASFEVATRTVEAAAAFGRQGVFAAEDLVLETAYLDDGIGGELERRCLGPVDAIGERGLALEETLRAFLASGMRYELTARELSMHPNTLRKRLARYEQLAGLDLKRMDDLVALWGALERRRVRTRIKP